MSTLFDYNKFFKRLKLSSVLIFLTLLFTYMMAFKNALLTIILSIITTFIFVKLLKRIKVMKEYVREENYYRFAFYDFILNHNLFKEDSSGKLIDSAMFSVIESENDIKVVAHKTGDTYTKKISNLDIELAAFIGLELYRKYETAQTVEYFFKEIKEIKQLVFSAEELTREFFNDIPLETMVLSPTQSFSLKSSSMMGIYGRTGSGKTITIQWYLISAIAKGSGTDTDSVLTVVDGKGADLLSLGNILKEELVGGNVSVGQTPYDLAKLSREFVAVMNERFKIIEESKTLNADGYDLKLTPNFLFVDELASIKDSCGSKDGKKLWEEILQNLSLIARKGRQASHHLVLCTQDPNVSNIPSELRSQITSVIYLQNPGSDRLKMAFSMCELENVPMLTGRKGEALFFADGRQEIEPERTIIPFIDIKTKQEFRTIINNIKPI
ncbi:cell division protein FtsK [Vagococcus fluvialis]|nr:cell division protein FtsK [Vagococcus fluvialis]NKD51417.1 cell division protein FtsK [Vagococcus fluvialis]